MSGSFLLVSMFCGVIGGMSGGAVGMLVVMTVSMSVLRLSRLVVDYYFLVGFVVCVGMVRLSSVRIVGFG